MRELLSGALSGNGGVALISGEAGIGKTTLAHTVMVEAATQGALLLSGRCFDLVATPPYGPWLEILSASPNQTGPNPLTPGPPNANDAQEASNPDALFTQFMRFMGSLSQDRPVVILLDDVHWADTASIELLRHFGRHLDSLPILLLVTYRSEEVNRRHPLFTMLPVLIREAHARRIALRRLDDVAMADWISRRYHLAQPDIQFLVNYVQQHAEGNPFFAGELLRTLEDEEALYVSGDGWRLGTLADIRIPLLLRQVIEGRLERVAEETRHLLSIAAIIGEEIDIALWQELAETGDESFLETLEDASEAGLLRTSSDGLSVRFDHALIRETLYEGVYPLRRRVWHRKLAEKLAASPTPDPESIAFHFRQASDPRAGEWLIKAGDVARDSQAFNAAFDRYEAALQFLETSGARLEDLGWLLLRLADTRVWLDERQGLSYLEEAKRIADETDDRALAVAILWHRGKLRVMAGDNGLPDLEESATLLQELAPEEREQLSGHLERGHSAESGTAIAFRMLASYYAHYGQYQQSQDLAEQLLTETPHIGDAELYEALGLSYSALGKPDDARWAFGQARDMVRRSQQFADLANITRMELRDAALVYHTDRLHERRLLADEIEQANRQSIAHGTVSNISPRWGILPLLFLEGEWDECLAITREAHDRGGIWRQTSAPIRGTLFRLRGNPELAWSVVRDALPRGSASHPENQYFDSMLQMQRLAIELALDAEDADAAQSWLQAHERWLSSSGRIQGRAELALLRARYHLMRGNMDLARNRAGDAIAMASEPRQPLALLAAHVIHGELDTQVQRFSEASAHIDDALLLADACGGPYHRGRVLLALADLQVDQGNRSDATETIDEAHRVLTLLDAKPALSRLARIHERMTASSSGDTGTTIDELTGREVEVLRLVAGGLTDAEVAIQLGISPRTVSNHLRSIYAKLDVTSRTGATRLAVERAII